MNLSSREGFNTTHQTPIQTFYKVWAQRYTQQMSRLNSESIHDSNESQEVALILHHALQSLSAEAWKKTEDLIAKEAIYHQVNPKYIDSRSISKDVHQVYDVALKQYADGVQPEQFAINIAQQMGQIRDCYTSHDPRVVGVVSVYFYYTGRLLLGPAYCNHQSDLELYVKAIVDYLYIPVHRACEATAAHANTTPELKAIQRLIPVSSKIAKTIAEKVLTAFPLHNSHSGPLTSALVKASSVRDIEMFQVYLWVCVLEGNAAVLQQELFPLCLMLYPILNVRWELVSYMLTLLEHELGRWLEPSQWQKFRPYLETLKMMFSTALFSESVASDFVTHHSH